MTYLRISAKERGTRLAYNGAPEAMRELVTALYLADYGVDQAITLLDGLFRPKGDDMSFAYQLFDKKKDLPGND